MLFGKIHIIYYSILVFLIIIVPVRSWLEMRPEGPRRLDFLPAPLGTGYAFIF